MFGERLKEERNKTNLSQEAFAALAGLGKKSQILYEKGERFPDVQYLQNIAELGCDIQYIVLGIPSNVITSREHLELMHLFDNADPILKEAAINVLNTKKKSVE